MGGVSLYDFRPITPTTAALISQWQYPPPYDVYNGDPEEAEYWLEPTIFAHSIHHNDELIGFVCFGSDGQVPGGDYSAEALDIGAGMRPDLTGHGNGVTFIRELLAFAERTFAPSHCRVTLAEFNKRVQRVCTTLGFEPTQTFQRTNGTNNFIVMLKASN